MSFPAFLAVSWLLIATPAIEALNVGEMEQAEIENRLIDDINPSFLKAILSQLWRRSQLM